MNQAAERMLLNSSLKHLKLPAMLRDYGECARQSRETGDSYETYLLALMVEFAKRSFAIGKIIGLAACPFCLKKALSVFRNGGSLAIVKR